MGLMALFTCLLDGAEMEVDPGATLAQALAQAALRLRESKRIIVEVRVDGEVLPGEALRARGEESLAGRRVEMETAQPRELAGAALGQLRSELDEARVLHESAAGKLQRGRWEDAVGDLRAALGHWQRVQAGVGQCLKLLGAGLLRAGDGPDLDLAPALDELAVRLRGLMESVRQRDTVAMADALVYEWPAAIDRWHELLEAMSQRIDDPHA